MTLLPSFTHPHVILNLYDIYDFFFFNGTHTDKVIQKNVSNVFAYIMKVNGVQNNNFHCMDQKTHNFSEYLLLCLIWYEGQQISF